MASIFIVSRSGAWRVSRLGVEVGTASTLPEVLALAKEAFEPGDTVLLTENGIRSNVTRQFLRVRTRQKRRGWRK